MASQVVERPASQKPQRMGKLAPAGRNLKIGNYYLAKSCGAPPDKSFWGVDGRVPWEC